MEIQATPATFPLAIRASIWSWIFEDEPYATPGPRICGYTDAITGQRLPFQQLKLYSERVSTVLHASFDVRPGDKISIFSHNSIWYPVALFAALRLGAIVSPGPAECTVTELESMLAIVRPKVVILGSSYAPSTEAIRAMLPHSRGVLMMQARDPVATGLESIEGFSRADNSDQGSVAPWRIGVEESNEALCALLCFSSGTTGLPKAIMVSHRNVLAQLCQVRAFCRPDHPRVVLGVLPFCHITGLIHLLHLPLIMSQEVIVMPRFTMETMLKTISTFRCEELWMVPPLLIRLNSDPKVTTYDLSSIRQFNTGAAPLAPSVIAALQRRFPAVAIRQAWGMTESCSCLTLTPPADQTYENAHTVGKAVPGTALRVVHPGTDEPVAVGEVGEIIARGPQVVMGYLDSPDATAETFGSGSKRFLRTGDIGFIDTDGFVHIKDRIKELIKVQGVGVAPAELEAILMTHGAVADAAVCGIHDELRGQVPKAYVVLRAGITPDSAMAISIQGFVRERASRAKWLRGGVAFLERIPKSASGKILRRKLASAHPLLELAWNGMHGRL